MTHLFMRRLKNLRAKRSISASSLAEFLGKSESAVRMWESGKNMPEAKTLIALADFLKCSTDFLLGVSNSENEMARLPESATDKLRCHKCNFAKDIRTALKKWRRNHNHSCSTK